MYIIHIYMFQIFGNSNFYKYIGCNIMKVHSKRTKKTLSFTTISKKTQNLSAKAFKSFLKE